MLKTCMLILDRIFIVIGIVIVLVLVLMAINDIKNTMKNQCINSQYIVDDFDQFDGHYTDKQTEYEEWNTLIYNEGVD